MAQFPSRDPLRLDLNTGLSLHGYVRNRSPLLVDPLGLAPLGGDYTWEWAAYEMIPVLSYVAARSVQAIGLRALLGGTISSVFPPAAIGVGVASLVYTGKLVAEKSNCATKIMDNNLAYLNWLNTQFTGADDTDGYVHCLTACQIKKNCAIPSFYVYWKGERRERVLEHDAFHDMQSNADGLACADVVGRRLGDNCETCCSFMHPKRLRFPSPPDAIRNNSPGVCGGK